MNILADLVDKSIEREYLKKAEQFQNRLIQNDVSISVLLDSVLGIKTEMANAATGNSMKFNEKLEQIATDIKTLQSYFETLKVLFKEEIDKSGVGKFG